MNARVVRGCLNLESCVARAYILHYTIRARNGDGIGLVWAQGVVPEKPNIRNICARIGNLRHIRSYNSTANCKTMVVVEQLLDSNILIGLFCN